MKRIAIIPGYTVAGRLGQLLPLLVLSATCTTVGLAAEETSQRFGKTPAQILAMGERGWMEFHGKRAGTSTAAMNQGMGVFRQALRERNDRLTAKAPASVRTRVPQLRNKLGRFTSQMMDIGSGVTGGGTIWSNNHAAALVSVEQTLYRVVSGSGPAAKKRRVSDVKKDLTTLLELIRKKSDPPFTQPERIQMLDTHQRASDTLDDIAEIAAGLSRPASDQVLELIHDLIWTAAGYEG